MKRILLITALAACFSMAWAFGNECSLLQEEESGFCGNPDVNMGMNLCYVVTNENDVKTLTIFRNPDAEGDDFGIAENFFSWWDFSVLVIEEGVIFFMIVPYILWTCVSVLKQRDRNLG